MPPATVHSLRQNPPVIPAMEAAVARNAPRRMVVDPRAVNRSKQKRRPITIFNPAEPPKGVLPPDAKTMAMDDQIVQVVGWANGAMSNFASAFVEGVTFMGYAYLAELAQRPEYRAISETIAYEMTREGITFNSVGIRDKAKKIADLEDAIKKRYHVMPRLRQAAANDGFFGRSHLYLDTGHRQVPEELILPLGDGRDRLSRSKVAKDKPLLAIRTVEPVWTYPTRYNSDDPLSSEWYKPTTWYVMAREIHESRLLTFVGREVPDILKPAYAFGGLSMSQMAKPYIDNWLKVRQATADIVWAFSVFVLKTNLSESLQGDGQELFDRAEIFNNYRNNAGLMMVDKDSEDFANVSAPLGGLDHLQAQAQEHMAAVSRIPIVKLLGIQPSGLNASSEGEIRSFYDWIKASQEHLFRANLQRIIDFIQLSLWGEVDEDIVFEFKDLWQLDAAGSVAVEKTKTDIDEANVAMGAIDAADVRKRIVTDKDSIYANLELSELPPEPEDDPNELLGLPNADPNAVPGERGESNVHQLPKPKDPSNRLATSLTNKAANFGGAVTGGFKGDAGEFKEEDHPRGQPGNAGQFGPGSTGKEGEGDRAAKVARLKEIGEKIKPIAAKEYLTAAEAREYEKLNNEATSLRFDTTRPLTTERVLESDMNKLSPSVVVAAHNDMLKNKVGYEALHRAMAGAAFNADTAIDNIMMGRNSDISASDFYHQFDETRKALREQFGSTVPLYRAEGRQKPKATTNWATTRAFAEQFGPKVIERDVPVDKIIAVNIAGRGRYHELIVGEPPSKHANDADPLTKAEVNYQFPAKGTDHCSACEHFQPPSACELVEGRIDADAWCEMFRAPPEAP